MLILTQILLILEVVPILTDIYMFIYCNPALLPACLILSKVIIIFRLLSFYFLTMHIPFLFFQSPTGLSLKKISEYLIKGKIVMVRRLNQSISEMIWLISYIQLWWVDISVGLKRGKINYHQIVWKYLQEYEDCVILVVKLNYISILFIHLQYVFN